MFRVVNILDPITGGSVTTEYDVVKGQSLAGYIGYWGDCVVFCNWEEIKTPVDKIIPAPGEEYSVMIIPQGSDRQTLRILGYAAMTVVSFIPGWGAPVAWAGGNLINLFLQDKVKGISESQSYRWQHRSNPNASQGLAMPVLYGKQRMRPTLKNRYVTVEGDKQRLYALYGVTGHKVDELTLESWPSNLMGRTTPYQPGDVTGMDIEPGKTYECIQQSVYPTEPRKWKVGHGTASFSGSNSIILNDRVIGDYGGDVEWETRPGLATQTVIVGFDATYTNYSQDATLYIDYPEVNKTEVGFDFDTSPMYCVWSQHTLFYHGFAYTVKKGKKLFSPANIGTNYVLWSATYKSGTEYYISMTPPTTGNGFIIYQFKVNASSFTNKIWPQDTTIPDLPTDTDWVRPVSYLTGAHNIELIFEFPNGLYGQPTGEAVASATCRLFAQYRDAEVESDTWKDFTFTIMVNAESTTDITKTDPATGLTYGYISRKKVSAFNISIRAVNINTDVPLDGTKKYEVRVTASSSSQVKLVNVSAILYGAKNADGSPPGFTYPGESLLGIKALASSQLNGDMDVQIDAERSLVWAYNDTLATWQQKPATNHAWAVYDMLAQGHVDHPTYPYVGNEDADAPYGCGINHTRLDYASFEEWADYIDELGYTLNIVFDTFMEAWDAILRVCQEGRGMVYPVGTKIYVFVDKPADVSQIFTSGNLMLDSFVQRYTGESRKATMIEATFWDKDNNYTETTIAIRSADWDSSEELNTPMSLTLYGTDTFEQAVSIAKFFLLSNEYLNSTATCGVDIDALAAKAGEVIGIQDYGQGGRIASVIGTPAAGMTITFDQILTMTPATTYDLTIRFPNGTTETMEITGLSSSASIVFGPGEFDLSQTPAAYDMFAFGVRGQYLKYYRIASISRTNELKRTLTLGEYDERVYESYSPGGNEPLTIIKPGPITPPSLLNIASNLRLQELVSRNRNTGEYESSILAIWDTETGNPRGMWEVWFRDVDASDVDWQGEWNPEESYAAGAKVVYDGVSYISLSDDNVAIPISITGG